MNAPDPVNWSEDDQDLEREFAEVITLVRDQKGQEDQKPVPRALDRRIKQIARGSAFDDIEKNWIFSSSARLTLAVLVFFAIAMLWVSL